MAQAEMKLIDKTPAPDGTSSEAPPPSYDQCEISAEKEDGLKNRSLSDTSHPDANEENGKPQRTSWGGRLDFLASCLSYAVGLGNIWRFPYICYRNGGGVFLIPYVIMLILAGMPLFFLELSYGQFAGSGVISIWNCCPLFRGIGFGMFLVSVYIAIYYNMVIAWAIHYLVASLRPVLPWSSCDNSWNTKDCFISGMNDTVDAGANVTANVTRVSPALEYFHNYVLNISPGFHENVGIQYQLMLCLLAAWVLAGACLIKGIQSSGKAAWFTAIFPYTVLVILLIRGLTLDGAVDGIRFYLQPKWENLAGARVWGDAAVQIFFSLSVCWGGLITLASYNRFHNNCLRDAVFVSIANCSTSFFAGFVIFAILGHMAKVLKVDIFHVVKAGPSLAFIVYPEVVSLLPISPLWSALFFVMLVTLGIGSQFAVVNTVHTTLVDLWPKHLRATRTITAFGKKIKLNMSSVTMVTICATCFMIALMFCTPAGIYILLLMDSYVAAYAVVVLAGCECLVISYIYGADNFYEDIKLMIGYRPSVWWRCCWQFLSPAILLFVLVFTFADFSPSKYAGYRYPLAADLIGWCFVLSEVALVPILAGIAIWRIRRKDREMSVRDAAAFLCSPSPDWLPNDEEEKVIYHLNRDRDEPVFKFYWTKSRPTPTAATVEGETLLQ